ncbi:MAG TPA: hypothetical protein VKV15_25900 [Bryobacteraceae bacterium]|jgi:hypothetical protein|nr:hypothetical protein [Bryobacteraceae bacterium]
MSFYRRQRVKRLDDFLIRFHQEAPLLFWIFAIALGAAAALAIMVLMETLS